VTQQKYFFFQYLSGASCWYTLFPTKALLVQQHTLQQSSSLGAAVNSSKSFLIALFFVALDNFTFAILTSVSNFSKRQLTLSFVERKSEVDAEVERNLSCHKTLWWCHILHYLRARKKNSENFQTAHWTMLWLNITNVKSFYLFLSTTLFVMLQKVQLGSRKQILIFGSETHNFIFI